MGDGVQETVELQGLLDRLGAGDAAVAVAAQERLIGWASRRLARLASRRLADFPGVRRWEQTDDVLQGAMIRLHRALGSVKPATARDFLNLCGTMVRRELIDLHRHHQGPEGAGAHHASVEWRTDGGGGVPAALDPPNPTLDPAALAEWTEFHRQVDVLPDQAREAFNLLWYQELSQEQAAAVVGVSVPTIKRRWREARYLLGQAIKAGDATRGGGQSAEGSGE